jgi:hypothetical protein
VTDRFDRFLPLAGVLAGLLFFVGLVLLRNDPSSETGPAETFAYWQADRGRHQIIALLLSPLMAFLLIFFGTGLKRRLERGGDSGHGTVAFGGALLAAAVFLLVAMLEGGMTTPPTRASAKPSTRSTRLTPMTGWAGIRPSRPCCSRPASVRVGTACCRPLSAGRRS